MSVLCDERQEVPRQILWTEEGAMHTRGTKTLQLKIRVMVNQLYQYHCGEKVRKADDPPGTLENVWVDGNNTFHEEKSDMPSPDEVEKIRRGPKFGF